MSDEAATKGGSTLRDKLMMAKPPPPGSGGAPAASSDASSKLLAKMRGVTAPTPVEDGVAAPVASPVAGAGNTAGTGGSPSPRGNPSPPPLLGSGSPMGSSSTLLSKLGMVGAPPPSASPGTGEVGGDGADRSLSRTMSEDSQGSADEAGGGSALMRKLGASMVPPGSTTAVVTPGGADGGADEGRAEEVTSPSLSRPQLPRLNTLLRNSSAGGSKPLPALGGSTAAAAPSNTTPRAQTDAPLPSSALGGAESGSAPVAPMTSPLHGGSSGENETRSPLTSDDAVRQVTATTRRLGARPVSMYGGSSLGREDSLMDLLKEAGDQYGKAFAIACKKFSTANKQLTVVARHATPVKAAKEKKKDKKKESASLQNLVTQLTMTREMLEKSNRELDEEIRRASSLTDDALVKLMATLGNTVKDTTFLINNLKAVALERPEVQDVYKQIVTATRTTRDALVLVSDTVSQAPAFMQNAAVTGQMAAALRTVKQSLAQLVQTQAVQSGQNLISGARRIEIKSAVAASVASCTRLMFLRKRNQDEKVVEMATVCATSISQLSNVLQETALSDLMLMQTQYQELLGTELPERLRESFFSFFEETRTSLGTSEVDDGTYSSPSYEALLEVIARIVAEVQALSELSPAKLDSDAEPAALGDAALAAARKIVDSSIPKAPPPVPDEEPTARGAGEAATEAPNIWDEPADCPQNVVYADGGRLKAANLNKLVECLTQANPPADITGMVKTFVTTYRSMAAPRDVLKRLVERWDVPTDREAEAMPIRLRVVNLVRAWAEANFQDFSPDDISTLRGFVREKLMASSSHQKFGQAIMDFIDRRTASHLEDVKRTLVEMKLEPKIPLSPAKFISVFDDVEIAKQLTLVEFDLYRSIQPVELLNQSWNVKKLQYRATNVRAMIHRSTALTMWVASCVLWQPTLKDRARVLTKLIRVADHVRRYNNFSALMAMISGINLSSVRRLRHTWSEISPADLKTFESMEALMSSDSAFAAYRATIKSVNPPCVPFLGVYLTDLTFSDDGNPDMIQGLINFSKRHQIYEVIQDLLQYTNTPYNFAYTDSVAAFLKVLPSNTDDDLYKISTSVEPKGSDKAAIT